LLRKRGFLFFSCWSGDPPKADKLRPDLVGTHRLKAPFLLRKIGFLFCGKKED